MRIGLIGCWHDDNRGDGAIVAGLISDLFKIEKDLDIHIFSMFSTNNCFLFHSFRHLKNLFPGISIHPSPIPSIYDPNLSLSGRFLRSINLFCLNFIDFCNFHEAIIPLLRSDLIISVGGYRLKSKQGGVVDLVRILFHSFPLLMARRYGKNYVIDAQSIGPIRGIIHTKIVRRVLSHATIVGIREPFSLQIVRKLKISAPVRLVPDAAISVIPQYSSRVMEFLRNFGLNNGNFIVLAPRQWFFGNYTLYADYLKQLAEFIENLEYNLVLVSHSIGPISIEDDRIACYDLLKYINKVRPILVQEDWSPAELAAFYGYALALIGVRFHSVLLSLIAGTPAIAIAYEGTKAQGIMSYFELDDFVLDINKLKATDLMSKFNKLIDNRVSVISKALDSLEQMRKERLQFVQEILESTYK
jgi:colanic acid/amylovoran biosynthesis protein